MKRKLLLSLTILISSCLIVLAGGGGGKSGGGGGGGGNTAPEWTVTTLSEYWYNASLGANTYCGTSFPRTSTNSNTCPTVSPQNLSNGGFSYYCKIIVQSLENPAETKTFCRGFYNTTQIEVPYRHNYKISYEFLEGCSNCMSPGMLTLPLGEGRRISWTREKSFNRFTLYPDINPGLGSLKNCQ